VGRPEGESPLGRTRSGWEEILKRIFRKWDGGMHWINWAQDRVKIRAHLNAVINYSKS